ncbi:MAG: AI-2E family transporter [Treponema sp.]|nr:AI-2E family transporter [Treponema sp.]
MNGGKTDWAKLIFFLIFFICIVIGGALMRSMEEVMKPVVLSVFMSFIFFAPVKALNMKFKIPWSLGITIVFVVFFAFFFGLGNIIVASFKSIFDKAPEYEERFQSVSLSLSNLFMQNQDSKVFELLGIERQQTLAQYLLHSFDIMKMLKSFAVEFTGTLLNFSKTLFFVVLFSFFLLTEMQYTLKKTSKVISRKHRFRILKIIRKTTTDVTQYISIKFVMSLISGAYVTLVCAIFKMDFAIIWGFLSFILNFIPKFGSLIAWAITTVFSVVLFYPSPLPIIFTSALIIVENIVIGNLIEPKIEGKNLDLSPFVILVSLSIWGWIWGFMGLLLAVPLTVSMKIICENISFLKPIAIFLGGMAPDHEKPEEEELPSETSHQEI